VTADYSHPVADLNGPRLPRAVVSPCITLCAVCTTTTIAKSPKVTVLRKYTQFGSLCRPMSTCCLDTLLRRYTSGFIHDIPWRIVDRGIPVVLLSHNFVYFRSRVIIILKASME